MKRILALFISAVLLTACSTTPIGLEGTKPVRQTDALGDSRPVPVETTISLSDHPVELPKGAKTSTEDQFNWRNATVYYAMTDRFYNGNPDNDESYGRKKIDAKGLNHGTFQGGDFKGLTDKISEGYFTDLGVNAIWLSAPYEQVHGFVGGGDGEFAHYAFHGYYALDWTMVDRNFGTKEEFAQLVDTAHAHGIRIILDVVLNHTGYNTLKDMATYEFGSFKNGEIDGNWEPKGEERYDAYHELINYEEETAWQKWWGTDWVRAGLPGYDRGGGDDYTMILAGLPDIMTEKSDSVDLPPVLVTKWAQERGDEFLAWRLNQAKDLRQTMDLSPAGYISAWLTAWVREFGIDGFRIDTAKHVELEVWDQLKNQASEALIQWRSENPDAPGADFEDDFFMVGEVWGQGLEKTEYHEHGFDALINFSFQGESFEGPAYRKDTMPAVFQRYADTLNDQAINVLTYISSHDTKLFPRKKLKDGLTYQLLLPGALEVFYGDETARLYVSTGRDLTMGTRSFMNWDDIDLEVFEHFKKLGTFRARNLAVGAGVHTEISQDPFIFKRDYNKGNESNTVLIAMNQSKETSLDVSMAFSDGDLLRDAYTMTAYKVEAGKIRLEPHESGLVLLERLIP